MEVTRRASRVRAHARSGISSPKPLAWQRATQPPRGITLHDGRGGRAGRCKVHWKPGTNTSLSTFLESGRRSCGRLCIVASWYYRVCREVREERKKGGSDPDLGYVRYEGNGSSTSSAHFEFFVFRVNHSRSSASTKLQVIIAQEQVVEFRDGAANCYLVLARVRVGVAVRKMAGEWP